MNILDQIIKHKKEEVSARKAKNPVQQLEKSIYFSAPSYSMTTYIRRKDRTGIIAEFKRRSPSRGLINGKAAVAETTRGYVAAGASALSVLTDREFFGGSNGDLLAAREVNACPILRKDFTVDEYQVIEAKSIGADAILLIAAVLDPGTSKELAALAHTLGMEVLLEVHNKEELLANLDSGADLIGVNNRNLKTFAVSTDVSKQLAPMIPADIVKVSESGISSPAAILELKQYGYEGFLIGENFMKDEHPGQSAANFMAQLKTIED